MLLFFSPSELTGLLHVELFCPVCTVSIFGCHQPKSNISINYNMLKLSVNNVIVSYGLRRRITNSLIHWLSVGTCNLFALRQTTFALVSQRGNIHFLF